MPRSDGHRLTGFGLTINSDRAIPGALPDANDRPPAIRITTLPSLPPDAPAEPLYRWNGDVLTFAAPGVGRYTCRRDAIDIALTSGADPDTVTALLIATALPALLWMRGGTMLHAAGVVALGARSALAIAGPSGSGKSALAAALLDDGAALLADDSICLVRGDGIIEGSGLPGGYHRRTHGDHRDFIPVAAARSIRTAPISTIIILSGMSKRPGLTRLSPVAAVERLLANIHRPAVPAILRQRADALATMAFVADHCAVYEWHREPGALTAPERDMLAHENIW